MKKEKIVHGVLLEKFVHGGQALGTTLEGKKILVWGGLPGEIVDVAVTKKKKSYIEGVAVDIKTASRDRIAPSEPLSYLSTSPWQILSFEAENAEKLTILNETYRREGIDCNFQDMVTDNREINYRNKQEFGFWGDEDGLHLAHFVRGTHGKQIITGSILTNKSINDSANDILEQLKLMSVWGGKLKTLLLRTSESGEVVAALFMKEAMDFSKFKLPNSLKGVIVYYSDPKSPASVQTKKLYSAGDIKLTDSIKGKNITYDVMSFFQVNLPVFGKSLEDITKAVQEARIKYSKSRVVDLYSGVGAIGLAVKADVLVEIDPNNTKYAHLNARGTITEVVLESSENALEQITQNTILIVDPPRAGLHSKLIDHINEVQPKAIIYLSCNPVTQARDTGMMKENYKISFARGYNFFPRTPHIESLVVLELK